MTRRTPPSLDRVWDEIPTGPAPVADLLAAGRLARRRRRRVAVAGAAAAVVATVAAAGVLPQALSETRGNGVDVATADQPSGPTPPAGTRFVGVGRVVVAVPEDWDSGAESCNAPLRDTTFFPYPQDCIGIERPGVSSVAITTGAFSETGTSLDGLRSVTPVGGYRVVEGMDGCPWAVPASCMQTFGIPELDAYFTVKALGVHQVEEIRRSLTVLPPEFVAVPFAPRSPFSVHDPSSARRAVAEASVALEGAGLSPMVERRSCPTNAYCVGTAVSLDPEPGKVVPVGSTVVITVNEDVGREAGGWG